MNLPAALNLKLHVVADWRWREYEEVKSEYESMGRGTGRL